MHGHHGLSERRQQIAFRLSAPDEMVGHHHMHRVVGAALRHVAGKARARRWQRHGVLDVVMTAEASLHVVCRSLWPMRNVMRIVAGQASHLAVAEAC